MINPKDLVRAGCKRLGKLYSVMDCQRFCELCFSDCGVSLDLGGSNSWYRHFMKNGWVGTPEECRKKFGTVPMGAILFIWEAVSESTPEKFKYDGIGDLTHMGLVTTITGEEMVDIAKAIGDEKDPGRYNFGDGAIHSSSSRKHVSTSKFAGKSISGGWNRVALWNKIDYGERINALLSGDKPGPSPEPSPDPEMEYAFVWSENGGHVHLRKEKSTKSKVVNDVPYGASVQVTEHGNEWSKVVYKDPCKASWHGYMMTKFLMFEDQAPKLYVVVIPHLSSEEADAIVAQYGGQKSAEEDIMEG